jgi:hypothetical protein
MSSKFPKPWYIQKFNFYSKRNFLQISAHLAHPRLHCGFAPYATESPLSPFGPSSFGAFADRHISFDFAHSGRDAFSLSRHCHVGPACQLHPLPHAGRPIATSPRRLWPPCPARPPTSRCQARSSLPALIPPFNPPLNPSFSRSPSMALRPLPSNISPFSPRHAPP